MREPEEFVERAAVGPFLIRGCVEPNEVLTWRDLHYVVNYTAAPRNYIRDKKRLPGGTAHQAIAALRSGATLQLEYVTPYAPRLAAIAGALSALLGGEHVDVNVYLSPAAEHPAFGLHHDLVDVFVVQISGQKHWRVHEPVVQDPTSTLEEHDYSSSDSSCLLDVVLEPGDVLFLRRGDPHRVITIGDDSSLHVNFRLARSTAQTALDWIVPRAAQELPFRRSFPLRSQGTAVQLMWMKGVLNDFSAWLAAQEPAALLEAFLDHQTVASTGFGTVAVADPLNQAVVGADTPVTLAHPLLKVRVHDAKLVASGEVFQIEPELARVAELLVERPTAVHTAASLSQELGVSAAAVARFLESLIVKNVVRLADPAVDPLP